MLYFFVPCLFLCVLVFFFVSRLFPKLKGVEEQSMSDNNAPNQIKNDVFISFRGQDIRDGFLSHLNEALKSKQINAFVDDKLERGDEIWASLVGEIKQSSISLIIFSQDYASSTWCLKELVTILVCKIKYGQIVIPVFYHVKPTHVRHQSSESYKKAFADHERNYETNVVQIWRDAMNKSTLISGIESSKFRNDAEIVKEIVSLVLTRLAESLANSKGLVGINEKIEDINSLICKEPKNTRVIGIWGMGGLGKTTLAQQVFNKLRSDYQGSYFLANEREQSSKSGIISLRKEIFSELSGHVVKIDTPNSLPIDRIRRMKVLIVLDDVNNSGHIEELLGTLDNFGPGSRIIITTRDKQVLNAIQADEIYQLKELSSDKAFEFFNLNAFNQRDHLREYKELSERVVDYAKGIPLVLKVSACHLRGKKIEVWESWLDKLKKFPPKEVYEVMKPSYNDLDQKEQQIFLDLACFFLGSYKMVNVSDLNSLLKDGENDKSVVAGLERLKDKALVTLSEDNFVSMHDSLQELAWVIVRQETRKPSSRSRLRDPDVIYEVLKKDKVNASIRSIRIQLTTIQEQKLMLHIFAKMSRLKFLEISVNDDYDCYDQLILSAEGLEFLATELRFLCWEKFPLESLPENVFSKKLVILKLKDSNMNKLWDGVKDLMNLKEVNLSGSKKLKELPDFSKATNLEILILRGCFGLTSVHPSIFSLPKLEKLDLWNCGSLGILTTYYHLRGLRYLNHDEWKNFREFSLLSEIMKEADPSPFRHQVEPNNTLHVTNSELERLPLCFNNFMQLLHLQVTDCYKLQTIPELPQFLKVLTVKVCNLLQSLPELPPSLEILNVRNCYSLQSLPKLPTSVKILYVHASFSLRSLPELSLFLETLDVQKCPLLQTLPVLPPSLKTLNVIYLKSLQSLPELPLFLKYLNASECKALKTVLFPSTAVEQLKENMTEVLFWNCMNLDEPSLLAIGLNAQINVMKFANEHLSSPNFDHVLNDSYYYGDSHLYRACHVYPGSSVPEWLEYKTTKDYINIDLSSTTPSPLLGFIFCFVFGKYTRTIYRYRRLVVQLKITKGESKETYDLFIDYLDQAEIRSDHVCVMYEQRCSALLNSIAKKKTRLACKNKKRKEENQTRLEIDVTAWTLPRATEIPLKGFGVSPINSSVYNSFIQQMESGSASYHPRVIKG